MPRFLYFTTVSHVMPHPLLSPLDICPHLPQLPPMGKKPRSIRPPGGTRTGRQPITNKARGLKYLDQAIEQGLTASEFAALAGIGVTHARELIHETQAAFRSSLVERSKSSLETMQQAAQTARADALACFAKATGLIGRRLDAMGQQSAPDAQEIATLTRAIAMAWAGMKDATGLGFAEARASAKLREDSSTKAALVPDVHVQFLDADPASDEGPEDGADSMA